MTFRIEDHLLGDLYKVDPIYAPAVLGAECGCHNPDGNGEGRMDFTGNSLAEIALAWMEHVESLEDLAPVTRSQSVTPESFVGLFTAGGDRVHNLGN